MINVYLIKNGNVFASFEYDIFNDEKEILIREKTDEEVRYAVTNKKIIVRLHPVSGKAVADIFYTVKKKKP